MKCPKCGSEMDSIDLTPDDTYPFPKPPKEHIAAWGCECGYEMIGYYGECGHEEKVNP